MDKIVEIYKKVKNIYDSDLSWHDKYDVIFSKEIQSQITFDWSDPDAGYEEDVKAFMDGFEKYISYFNFMK
jgi:hypothetical protein